MTVFALEMEKVKRIRMLSFLQGTTLSLLKLSVLFTLLWLIFRDVLSTGELIAMQRPRTQRPNCKRFVACVIRSNAARGCPAGARRWVVLFKETQMSHHLLHKRLVVSAVTATLLALGSTATIAQPRGDQPRYTQDDRRGPPQRAQRPQARDNRQHDARERQRNDAREQGRRQAREHDRRARESQWRQPDRSDQARQAYRPGPPPHSHAGGRGAGPQRNIYRGAPLPVYYRTQHYVVRDWHGHRLYAPPRGHHWVQVGADYVLVAIATGLIVHLMLGY